MERWKKAGHIREGLYLSVGLLKDYIKFNAFKTPHNRGNLYEVF